MTKSFRTLVKEKPPSMIAVVLSDARRRYD